LWRRDGTSTWAEAVSVNASRSGVLFRCDGNPQIELGAPVEFIFGFSWEPSAAVEIADVRCSGRIVRTLPSGADDSGAMLAAAIDSYSFITLP
jgi:hypothetical protein